LIFSNTKLIFLFIDLVLVILKKAKEDEDEEEKDDDEYVDNTNDDDETKGKNDFTFVKFSMKYVNNKGIFHSIRFFLINLINISSYH
jgi:hypothetical protein